MSRSGIRVTNDGPVVALDLGKAGKLRLRPGAARGLAGMLEDRATRAEVVRGPVDNGPIRGEDDAMGRLDGILGSLAGMIKKAKGNA